MTNRSKKKLTPKQLGLVPETVLSEMYDNRKNNFKVLTGRVIAYSVIDGGVTGYSRVAPMFEALIYMRVGKTQHIITSYERGQYINSYELDKVDQTGNVAARGIAASINTLECWARSSPVTAALKQYRELVVASATSKRAYADAAKPRKKDYEWTVVRVEHNDRALAVPAKKARRK